MPPNGEKQRMWRLAGRYSAVGIEMAVCLAVGTLGGDKLDKIFGTAPYLFFFGTLVGVGAMTKTIIRIAKDNPMKSEADIENETKGDRKNDRDN